MVTGGTTSSRTVRKRSGGVAEVFSIAAIVISLWSLWLNRRTARFWRERAAHTDGSVCE